MVISHVSQTKKNVEILALVHATLTGDSTKWVTKERNFRALYIENYIVHMLYIQYYVIIKNTAIISATTMV